MTSAVLSGRHLLESAKMQSFAQEIFNLKTACEQYKSSGEEKCLEYLKNDLKSRKISIDCDVEKDGGDYKVCLLKSMNEKQIALLRSKIAALMGDEVIVEVEGIGSSSSSDKSGQKSAKEQEKKVKILIG